VHIFLYVKVTVENEIQIGGRIRFVKKNSNFKKTERHFVKNHLLNLLEFPSKKCMKTIFRLLR
jgi:hypothetical protein